MKTGTVVTVVLTAIIFAAIGYGVGDVTMQEPANDTTSQAQTLPAGIDPSLIVRPLAEMVDGDLPAMVDITHTDAVLVFRSSIPLACSVAYGPTLELGMIATDPDMAGAAIVDHNPTLGGLEPDTEYFYRVQGTAADGTIYVGDVARFRTAPEPPPAVESEQSASVDTPVVLTALGGGMSVLAVSSNYGGAADDQTWGVNQAFDGNVRSAWSSDGDGDDVYVTVDLGSLATVTAVEVWTRTMSDGTAQILSFTLTGDDGVLLGPFELPDAAQAYRFEVAMETKTLRLDAATSTGGNTGLIEFAVLGIPRP